MIGDVRTQLDAEVAAIRAAGTFKEERVLTSPQGPHVTMPGREGERIFVPQPASEWLGNAIYMSRRNPGVRRRTWTAIQILVATSDCKVCATRIQLNGDDSR